MITTEPTSSVTLSAMATSADAPKTKAAPKKTECDILCGQSRACANHKGNETFQSTLDTYATRYDNASKQEKMMITKEIVACIHDTGGRFLKYKNDDGVWEEISNVAARDKVSHALRTKVASWKRQQQHQQQQTVPETVSTVTTTPPIVECSATKKKQTTTEKKKRKRRSSTATVAAPDTSAIPPPVAPASATPGRDGITTSSILRQTTNIKAKISTQPPFAVAMVVPSQQHQQQHQQQLAMNLLQVQQQQYQLAQLQFQLQSQQLFLQQQQPQTTTITTEQQQQQQQLQQQGVQRDTGRGAESEQQKHSNGGGNNNSGAANNAKTTTPTIPTLINPRFAIQATPTTASATTRSKKRAPAPTTAATITNKKRAPVQSNRQRNGAWNEEEKNLFFDGLRMYGEGDWKSICEHVRSRDRIQTRNFGLNYFKRLERDELKQKRIANKKPIVNETQSQHFEKVEEIEKKRESSTTKVGNPAAPKGKRRRCCIAELEVALVEQQKQKNGKYFVDHFAVAFKPKEEIKNNTVKVITESDPEAIFKASETNTTMSLTIAPAEHDLDCHQVCGKLPVTENVRQAFTTDPTSVVPLRTEEEKLERSRAYQRSYHEANRERERVYHQSYSKSEANRCSFSQEYCKKRKQSRCNGMCMAHYRQSLVENN